MNEKIVDLGACLIKTNDAATIVTGERTQSLRVNICWTFAGNLVNAACQWGVLAILAKLGNVKIVGEYSWAQAVVTPLIVGAMLQLRSIFVTDPADERYFGNYLGLRMLAMLLSLLVVACYGLWAAADWTAYLVVLFVGVMRAADGISDLFRGYFQKHEMMELVSKNLMLRGGSAFLLIAALIQFTGNLPAGIAAASVAFVFISLLYDVPQWRRLSRENYGSDRLRIRIDWEVIRGILPGAIPMGIVMGLINLQSSIPRLFLQHWEGASAVGYFSAAFYPIMVGTLIVGSLGESALPRMSRLALSNRRGLLLLLLKLEVLAFLTGLVLIGASLLGGRMLLETIYSPSFGDYWFELVILAISALFSFMASFLGYALTAARQFYVQPIMALLACVVSTVVCALWVPRGGGVTGAAFAQLATAAAALLTSAACFFQCYRLLPAAPKDKFVEV